MPDMRLSSSSYRAWAALSEQVKNLDFTWTNDPNSFFVKAKCNKCAYAVPFTTDMLINFTPSRVVNRLLHPCGGPKATVVPVPFTEGLVTGGVREELFL